ncbi:MAG: dihydroorotate dehydrogenase electron transfer subunit [Oscillospiraceae bacterium]|nr:dihydroorotate dehydrogenase electron transfer subunit [Oscillospiraceae bacterium]
MKKERTFGIVKNTALTRDVFEMVLTGDSGEITRPGQFVNISLPELYLRRPISVCDWTENTLTLVYKVVGKGTDLMSRMEPGEKLGILTGLGNGYKWEDTEKPLLIGGGVGVPPLYGLAKRLTDAGKDVTVILGFNTAGEVFYKDEFEKLGAGVIVTTVDGSMGIKGFAAAPMADIEYDHYFCCGPMPMLKAVWSAAKSPGQLSFEERMGCGFGACMGCTVKTKNGNKRICKDGPVLDSEEILW